MLYNKGYWPSKLKHLCDIIEDIVQVIITFIICESYVN